MKLDYVNARVGTLNERRFSNGNIYPVTAMPFGMAHFTLQTDGGNGNWFYSPQAHSFEGFRLTHQPSPWVGDYGHMLFLPYSGELARDKGNRWTSFRPERAVIRPDKMRVFLQRYGVDASLTPTERGCVISLKNEENADMGIAFMPFVPSQLRMEGNALRGHTDAQSIWGFARVREYFYITFDRAPALVEPLEDGGMAVKFAAKEVSVAIATSFVSEEQAERNYMLELKNKDFAQVRSAAASAWEELLSKIEVSDENPARRDMFYSCLYRALLYPRKFYEYDKEGKPCHFNADTQRVEAGVFYTDNGFWDTYRTVYPLLSLIAPERMGEMIKGFLNYADETGWLPKWLSPGEIGLMPGTLIEAVLSDAAVKGILSKEQMKRAYRAMLKNAYEPAEGTRHGRQGAKEYMAYGYVPGDMRESVNHTCDSAYGDFCISVVARLLGEDDEADKLLARSKNYANLFDKETRFLRGKDRAGNFREPFDPFSWGGDNCEGSSWQSSFAACHDVEGLARLHGGEAALASRLDELFSAPPVYRVGGYGQEIHEMSEMACVDFGQCAISNQPSFHIPWLYAALGQRQKTEFWVEKLVNEAFFCTDDGFPGDEDNGTMAAWYVFACLGFYPLCPGKAEYVASKPLFKKISLCGKSVGRAKGPYLSHFDLANAAGGAKK